MARKRKVEQDAPAVDAEELDASLEAQPEVVSGSVEEQEGAPVVEDAAPAPVPTKWVVMEEQRVSLFGQITTLPAGTIVSVASYGPEGMRRLIEQQVQLAPLE